jgi:ketosteroid isomerase-like protein
MNRSSLCAILSAFVLSCQLSGCAAPAPPPASVEAGKDTTAQDLAALRATEEKLGVAIAARDVDGIDSFYTPDAWFFPPDGAMSKTAEGRRAYWSNPKMSAGFTAVQGMDSKREVAKSGELVVEYGSYFEVISHKDGATTYLPRKFVTAWQKQADGGWKVITHMWNETK